MLDGTTKFHDTFTEYMFNFSLPREKTGGDTHEHGRKHNITGRRSLNVIIEAPVTYPTLHI